MNSEQANSVADALLQKPQAQQAAVAQNRAGRVRLLLARRRTVVYGLAGFAVGALAGYLIFPWVLPVAIIGMGLGMVIGRWFVGRGA
jgi:fatty acid desaturase